MTLPIPLNLAWIHLKPEITMGNGQPFLCIPMNKKLAKQIYMSFTLISSAALPCPPKKERKKEKKYTGNRDYYFVFFSDGGKRDSGRTGSLSCVSCVTRLIINKTKISFKILVF